MSILSITPNTNNSAANTLATHTTTENEKKTPSKTLKELVKNFWSYTETMGESDTSSYDGWF